MYYDNIWHMQLLIYLYYKIIIYKHILLFNSKLKAYVINIIYYIFYLIINIYKLEFNIII